MNIQHGVGEDSVPGRFAKHDFVLRKHPFDVPLLVFEYLLCLFVCLLVAVVKLLDPDDKHLRNPEEDPSGDQEGIVQILFSFEEMAAAGHIDFDELRERLAGIEDERVDTERALEAIQRRREHLEQDRHILP
jgi:hypothetical protein